MGFVSCAKQVTSFTAALATANTADQSAFVKSIGSAKEVSFASFAGTNLKRFDAAPFGTAQGESGIVYTPIGWDAATNTSFGTWNGTKDTFTFAKSGVYRIESNVQVTSYYPVYSDTGIAAGVLLLFRGLKYQGVGFNSNTREPSHFGGVGGGNSWVFNIVVGDTVSLQGYRSSYSSPTAQSSGEQVGLGAGTSWVNTFTISQN